MILILGGTGDSILLVEKLSRLTDKLIISTATEYGADLARTKFKGLVVSGKMDRNALIHFIQKHDIRCIIDATHPYAQIITENALQVSDQIGISYYRYERPKSKALTDMKNDSNGIQYCKDYETAGKIINEGDGNVLVTTGSRHIEKLVAEISDIKRIYARILPKSEHLIKLEALGFMPEQIIAMKGPFGLEINKLMLAQTKAQYLVTKESGSEGKTDEKVLAAQELSIKVIVIQRPNINYTYLYDNMDELVYLIQQDLLLNVF